MKRGYMGKKIYNLIPALDTCGNLRRFMADWGLFAVISAVLNRLENLF
jgi:hypothetical protein